VTEVPGEVSVKVPVTQAPSSSARIPQLDGLRGVAILLVVGSHYLDDARHGAFGSLLYGFVSPFRLGWAGVDLFFVLSGFLIGGILLENCAATNYFSVFYLRRLHRIVPIYFLWITLYVLTILFAGAWLSNFIPLGDSPLHPVPYFYLFLQNYRVVPFDFLIWPWLAVAWSLGVEEQFYFLAPPLVRYLSLQKLRLCLLGAVLIAPVLRVFVYLHIHDGHYFMYSWMPCRADSLALGVLAALAWRDRSIPRWYAAHRHLFFLAVILLLVPVAILLAPLSFFLKKSLTPYTLGMGSLGYSWFALLFTALLLLCLLEPAGLWSRFLRLGFLREFGAISYCLYLIHLGILHLTHALILNARPRIYDLPGFGVTALAFLLSYVLAKLSWIYFEQPLIRRGHSYRYQSPA
jgi:peptidoglycan/LPS O-acetylase OafA/YrhL